jgi:hypothetical protein
MAYPSNKMWTGTVSFKSIETGEPVRKDKTMIASTRQALEVLYLFDFELMDKNTVYMTIFIDSPIGTFFVDPMGWQAIHDSRKLANPESSD